MEGGGGGRPHLVRVREISLHLPTSPHISPHLPTPPHILLHLATSRYISLYREGEEAIVQPRAGVHFPYPLAFAEADRQMLSNGITTAFHALTVSWEPGLRSIEALASMTRLRSLYLKECSELPSLKGLPPGEQLQLLNFNGCMKLKDVDPLTTLTSLRLLGIRRAQSENFDGFVRLVERLRAEGGMLISSTEIRYGQEPRAPALKALVAGKRLLILD